MRNALSLFTSGICIMALMILSGCAPATGDFGRQQPNAWNDDVLTTVGKYTARKRGEPVSRFPLTDDEKELRNRAWGIIMPASPQSVKEAKLIELRRTRILPASEAKTKISTYGTMLLKEPYASSIGRYRHLLNDINSDREKIPTFFDLAEKVRDTDRIRENGLRFIANKPDDEEANAQMRITENQIIVWWAHDSLVQRAASYRYALERLLVETPESEAVQVERMLMALENDIRYLSAIVYFSGEQPFYRNGEVLYSK